MLTRDHVPPRSLFAPDTRALLPTVPSCAECNSGASKDDEYFRAMMVMRDDVTECADARFAGAEFLRALQRRDHVGLRNATLRNVVKARKYSESGLYLGLRDAYNVNPRRLDRVVRRIVRGLYWHEVGGRLPLDYTVAVFTSDRLDGNLIAAAGLMRMAEFAASGTRVTFPGKSFEYAFRRASDNPNGSAWLMTFYGRVHFVALTLERTRARFDHDAA